MCQARRGSNGSSDDRIIYLAPFEGYSPHRIIYSTVLGIALRIVRRNDIVPKGTMIQINLLYRRVQHFKSQDFRGGTSVTNTALDTFSTPTPSVKFTVVVTVLGEH